MKQRLFFRANNAFTIVELLIAMVVIGILVTVSVVGYGSITSNATEKSVLSDLDTVDALQTQYGVKNGVGGKDWYSGNGVDSDLGFTPSTGNVIDVNADTTGYCIRVYNAKTSYSSISSAAQKEANSGDCARLAPFYTAPVLTAPVVTTSGKWPIGVGVGNMLYGYTGSGVLMSVTYTGSPTPTVQWQKQAAGGGPFTNIPGATSNSYTTPALTYANNGEYYRAVVTNSQGTDQTNAAYLIMDYEP